VNLFPGRGHQGRVTIGQGQLDAPECADAENRAGVAYARTYDMQLHRSPFEEGWLEAVVSHVHAFGPVIRVELDLVKDGRAIEAHLPRSQFDQMPFAKGERLYVAPTNVRVFPDGR